MARNWVGLKVGGFGGSEFWRLGGGSGCLQDARMMCGQGIAIVEVVLFLSFLDDFRGFSRWEVWSLQSGLEMLVGQGLQGPPCRNL